VVHFLASSPFSFLSLSLFLCGLAAWRFVLLQSPDPESGQDYRINGMKRMNEMKRMTGTFPPILFIL
jgi:hypothetical protein